MMEKRNLGQKFTSHPVVVIFFLTVFISFLFAFFFPGNIYLLIVSGILMLFFLPGYVIANLIFPKEEIPSIIKYILFIVISTVVLASVAILLTTLKIPLFNPDITIISPLFLGVLCVSVCALIIGELRSSTRLISSPSIPASEKKFLSLFQYLRNASHNFDKLSICLLAFIICLLIGGYFISTSNQYATGTEFYLLNSEGKIIDYPLTLFENETPRVIVGIVNYEHTHMEYILIMVQDNTTLSSQNVSLNDNEKWLKSQSLPIVSGLNPEKQKIEFKLYKKDDITEPYRRLHLWITQQ
jgi:uncharacterized membrane protein